MVSFTLFFVSTVRTDKGPVWQGDWIVDVSTFRTQLCWREKSVYDNGVLIPHKPVLDCTQGRMLHMTAKESFMPSSDVFILDDNDIMILLYLRDYLHRLVFPSGIQTLRFSSDFPYSSIPAIGAPGLTGKLSLHSLQTLAFSDPYIICIASESVILVFIPKSSPTGVLSLLCPVLSFIL